jgi:hypothetical protein
MGEVALQERQATFIRDLGHAARHLGKERIHIRKMFSTEHGSVIAAFLAGL